MPRLFRLKLEQRISSTGTFGALLLVIVICDGTGKGLYRGIDRRISSIHSNVEPRSDGSLILF